MATGRFPQRSGTVSRKWKVEMGKGVRGRGSGAMGFSYLGVDAFADPHERYSLLSVPYQPE